MSVYLISSKVPTDSIRLVQGTDKLKIQKIQLVYFVEQPLRKDLYISQYL